ncbi:phosphatase PAP2 family protein [Methyloversatilis sp.]|uniref:phosphatase PAP2 family protein n=1 Tax=Methyloversatilis sp. TaxID=2569862 RepID=UPI002736FE6A|nr:phosphatase PAP2 family protein [Methyloversatilis sp.]MDP2869894.1 phosphatase PAP2 family protein [Methyloversatilis sp.]MDP3289516.1 phosphatase PAP2 family protein [Methyloversatilis sp.]MDP3454850.1 phosphatase PAP2 family protein [Methyloversatilis sp.]MDP3576992.1 phosphatase PAP2 family protein [Methyloversatilis sp.]
MNALLAHPQLLADFIAQHAVPLCLGTLGVAFALATAGHTTARRLWPAGARTRVQIATTGAICLLCALLLFSAIASAVSADGRLVRLDHALAAAMAAHQSAGTLGVFARLTHFGDTVVLTALCIAGAAALLAGRERLLAAALVAAIGGNSLLNHSLKAMFERVRPLHEHGQSWETSWSFPSGHSSGTLVAYGMAAWILMQLLPARWHLPVLLSAVAIALVTALSRIVLHVHYASDVMAGFASGSAWLALCITIAALFRRRSTRTCNHPASEMPEGTAVHKEQQS